MLKNWNEGFIKYHEKNFIGALESFKTVLALSPNDEPSKLYIERCEDYIGEPPAEDWDGVFEMKSK